MAHDLRHRNHQSELMDDPALDDVSHRNALKGLRRINWWSRTDKVIWNAVRSLAAKASPDAPLSILDIASGGGDLAVRLAQIARQEKLAVRIHGCDISPTAIACAAENAETAQLSNVSFHQCNAIDDPLPQPHYDVVMCSLFLHHLTEQQAVLLLSKMKAAASQVVLVDDLRRTRLGYWLAWLGCRILTRCHIVHVDGPMSVEGAFEMDEVRTLAETAGLSGVQLINHWPQRFLLSWRQPGGSG